LTGGKEEGGLADEAMSSELVLGGERERHRVLERAVMALRGEGGERERGRRKIMA
jgi:hypothetical protein